KRWLILFHNILWLMWKCLVAIRGRPAVLGCEFTPDSDLSSLVVTWQRQEDSQVIHSFYYQQDNLDRQSPEYHNRTSLYISELGKGNASLRINPVGPKDAGWYLCQVSNAKGTGKALIELDYGGVSLYSEPRLNIHVNSTTVTVQFETEGFPKPEVIWLGENNQNLSYHLEIYNQTEDGLYYIKSSYEAQKPVVIVTFTPKNHLLNQNLQTLMASESCSRWSTEVLSGHAIYFFSFLFSRYNDLIFSLSRHNGSCFLVITT
uniref:Ig-like domain-containing protein n=1 Tax=Sinocyclocheilus anshuiensis TaxID=1608454 RepID=A0A671KY64_9TELE